MRNNPNLGVDWEMWLRSRPRDVRRPGSVITPTRGGRYCQLCCRMVAGATSEHHAGHMLELKAWQAGQQEGPRPDSVRRSENRRARRQEAIDRAVAVGEDSFRYAVERIDPGTRHRKRKRRLRHPRAETIARVRALHAAGRMPQAIGDELGLSTNYTRRLLREMEGQK